jgi:hypothetical protein
VLVELDFKVVSRQVDQALQLGYALAVRASPDGDDGHDAVARADRGELQFLRGRDVHGGVPLVSEFGGLQGGFQRGG